MGRYLVVSYKTWTAVSTFWTDSDPYVQINTDDLGKAQGAFDHSKGYNYTAVLFDATTKKVLNKFKSSRGQTIHLAKAVVLARSGKPEWSAVKEIEGLVKLGTEQAVGQLVSKAGGPPGAGGALVAHFTGPIAAAQGKGITAAKAATGLWGGLSGGVVGFLIGGPPGAAVGAFLGSTGSSMAVGKLLEWSGTCRDCGGEGLIDDYLCLTCSGYGFVGENLH